MKKVFSEAPIGVVANIPGKWPMPVRSGIQDARRDFVQDIRNDLDNLRHPKVGQF